MEKGSLSIHVSLQNMVMLIQYFVVLSFSILHNISFFMYRKNNQQNQGMFAFVLIPSIKLHTLTDMAIFHQTKENNAYRQLRKPVSTSIFHYLQLSKICMKY